MSYNAADPAQVKRAQQKSKDAQDQKRSDLKALLQLPEFRRFIWEVIHEKCKLMVSPFSTNGSAMTHAVGMQELAKQLWTDIEAVEPLAIPKMMTEYYQSKQPNENTET